jgi:hypothetical protein
MDELTRWNVILGLIASCVVIIGFVYGLLRREGAFWKFLVRSISGVTIWLLRTTESLFYTLGEWWNAWGSKFTVILIAIVVLAVGIFYLAKEPNPIGLPFLSLHSQAQSYSTHTPGSHCDKGAGQWKEDAQLHLTCLTDQLGLTYTGDGSDFYGLYFNGSDGMHNLFNNSYSVHVAVTFPDSSDAYVGVGVHGVANKAICGQMGWIQANGAWVLYQYKNDGSVDATLETGSATTSASTYTLDIAVQGALITLVVNGVFATSLTDNTYQNTSYVCIGMGGSPSDTVTVRDFEFTPHS